MPGRVVVAIAVLLAVASCGGDGGPGEGSPATAFTWETTIDQGGFGYVLVVDGVVGEGHAGYSMQVEPLVAGGGDGSDDAIAGLAGVAVNGLTDDGGIATSLGPVDPDGETVVRVREAERWYRNPWLQGELADVVGDDGWVRVAAAEPVLADLVTSVLNERYDEALRRLLGQVRAGDPVVAPSPEEAGSELDETLTPWIGLVGPAYPIGAAAERSGDAEEGSVSWRDERRELDGAVTTMAGTVSWRRATANRPDPPSPAVDVAEVTAALGG